MGDKHSPRRNASKSCTKYQRFSHVRTLRKFLVHVVHICQIIKEYLKHSIPKNVSEMLATCNTSIWKILQFKPMKLYFFTFQISLIFKKI